MLNIALTGNIAAGKSTVVALLRRWGATVIDADLLTREAQAPGTETLTAIVSRFGADVLHTDGTLDRDALRAKVMGDETALTALNAIVHPVVRRRRDELQREASGRGDLLLVNDIPLLFEALDPAQFDVVILVDAPPAVRRVRLRSLRQLSNEDADRMLAAQMSAERKRARSDFVIENDGSLTEVEARARGVFDTLRDRAARASWATTPGPIALATDSPKDPDGPGLATLGAALGAAGVVVYRVAGKAPTVQKGIQNVPPALIVATPAALPAVLSVARKSSGAPRVAQVAAPQPGGVVFDLRPWGGVHVGLTDKPLA